MIPLPVGSIDTGLLQDADDAAGVGDVALPPPEGRNSKAEGMGYTVGMEDAPGVGNAVGEDNAVGEEGATGMRCI